MVVGDAPSPTLYIFSGLPGTGKTTLSRLLAVRMGALHLRIDTVEQGLRDLCGVQVEGEGYGLSYRIAADNLRLGLNVVADSCNPIELTRREWEAVARDNGAHWRNIEVVCSDLTEHRCRVETREPGIPTLKLPSWQEVVQREYEPWRQHRLCVDTAGRSVVQAFHELCALLESNS